MLWKQDCPGLLIQDIRIIKMSLSLPASLDRISNPHSLSLFAEMREGKNRKAKNSILLAEESAAAEIIHAALGTYFDLHICHTLRDAREYLHGDIRIVLCGLHFDGCRLFELLQIVRKLNASAPPYFVGINTRNKLLADDVIRIAAESIWATGGDGLIDFSRWCMRLGTEEACHRLRWQLECLLFTDKKSDPNLTGGRF
jgi:hypothetical protein